MLGNFAGFTIGRIVGMFAGGFVANIKVAATASISASRSINPYHRFLIIALNYGSLLAQLQSLLF